MYLPLVFAQISNCQSPTQSGVGAVFFVNSVRAGRFSHGIPGCGRGPQVVSVQGSTVYG